MKYLYLLLLFVVLPYVLFATGPITGSATICAGTNATLSAGSSGGTWSSSNTTVATIGPSTGVLTGVAGGTTIITYNDGTGIAITTVTVNAAPLQYHVTGGGSFCSGTAGVPIGTDGSDAACNYTLLRAGTPVDTLAGTGLSLNFGMDTVGGMYTIKATNATTGCQADMVGSATIVVSPVPMVVPVYLGSGSSCTGYDIYLPTTQPDVYYQLYNGALSVGSYIVGSGTALSFGIMTVSGTYSVLATNSSGCMRALSSVTVAIAPMPGPITGPGGVCMGSSATLSNTSTGGTWTSSTPSVVSISASSGVITGVSTGTATVTYTTTSGCSVTRVITVSNTAGAITGSSSACSGLTVTLANAASGGTWSSSSTAVASVNTSGIVTGIAPGTVVITYSLGGTCGYTTKAMTVNIAPAAITGLTSVCSGNNITLANTVTGGTWTSGNTALGTISTSGVFHAILHGNDTVSYTLSSGCARSVIVAVDATPLISGTPAVCVGGNTTLSSTVYGVWSSSGSGIATASYPGIVTGVSLGTVTVACTAVSTGCMGTYTVAVTSTCTGTPVAGIAHVSDTSACPPQNVSLSVTGYGASCGTSFQWQRSPDGITWDDIPAFVNPTATTYIRGKATCASSGLSSYTDTVTIAVHNRIGGHTVSITPSIYCDGPRLSAHVCGYGSPLNLITQYGDGTSDTSAVTSSSSISHTHVYAAPGTYTAKYILRNGATPIDSATDDVNYTYCRTLPIAFYLDGNSNCVRDAGENIVSAPISVAIDSQGTRIDTISCYGSFFYKALGGAGTVYAFTVLTTSTSALVVSCPSTGVFYDTITSIVSGYSTTYVGMTCATPGVDLHVSAGIGCGRHTAGGTINIGNSKCTPTASTVTMHFSPKYHFVSSYPAPVSTTFNSATWNIDPMSAISGGYRHINYTLEVPGPLLTTGDTVYTDYTITPYTGDIDTTNNYVEHIDTVKSSFDPNEIIVHPGGLVIPCTELNYTIHFENDGNDTARNIYVMDTLSDAIDINSVQIRSATSAMTVAYLQSGGHNIIKFDFPNINLPDSAHHNQCNGGLEFTAKTLPALTDGTAIHNRAGIYFDDNPVVMTNEVINTIGIAPVTGPASVCVDGTVLLGNASEGGAWASSSASASVTGGTVTGISAGATTISYTLANTCGSRTSILAITVNSTVAPSITLSNDGSHGDSTCMGSTLTFTAHPVNGGGLPVYQWKVNTTTITGITGNTYSYIPANGDVITVKMTSSALCPSPDTAVVHNTRIVTTPMVPAVVIDVTPGTMISSGTSDTLTATVTGGGTTPRYQWMLNGTPISGATNFRYISSAFNDGDSVTCLVTAGDICGLETFNSVLFTVTPVGVSDLDRQSMFKLFPNPNDGRFILAGPCTANQPIALSIVNTLGQIVNSESFMSEKQQFRHEINNGLLLNPGIYLLQLHQGTATTSLRFTIAK